MKNFVQAGEKMKFTNGTGAAIKSGDAVVVGERLAVADVDIADGDSGTVSLEGVYRLAKAAGALTQGQKLFFDKAAKVLTGTASSDADIVAGIAFLAAANGDAEAQVKLGNVPKKVAIEAAVATADGSDAATTQALANALKTSFNSLLTKLKASGVMDN